MIRDMTSSRINPVEKGAGLMFGASLVVLSSVTAMAQMTPVQLRCEYLVNPLGLDVRQPRLSWVLQASGRAQVQTAYRILVADSRDALAKDDGNLWDSGKVDSDETIHIAYDGKPLTSGQTVFWKTRVWDKAGAESPWSEPASWQMGLLEPDDWTAKWIGKSDTPPNGPLPSLPPAMLRKDFNVAKPVARATAFVTALGLYELRLNGQKVGQALLTPEWTDYATRVQVQAYDVTPMLKEGDNAVGALLADGWYAGRIGISVILGAGGQVRGFYGRWPHLRMQMQIEYADGSRETVITDESWQSTTDGPIRKACILDGEVYDAQKEQPGWDGPGFKAEGWKSAHIEPSFPVKLVAQRHDPIRVTQELKAVAVTEPAKGIYVFDFGQNIAGACRLKIQGKAGLKVRLRHAEVLQPDGNIYRDNLRIHGELGARQEDEYTCRGEAEETWVPRFTYHGFRYVEVAGLPAKPAPELLTGLAFHSAPPMTSGFESSSALLNKLMLNTVWTLRDNLHSIPTDCPQRDERMGWTGDILAFGQTACFQMDMAAFLAKWLQDLRDDQARDGRFPDFAPHPFDPDKRFSGVPAWGDAGVFVPWYLWVSYGDKRVLDEHYDAARRWVDWIHSNNPDLLWKNNRNNDYGDWLNGDTLKLTGFGFPEGKAQMSPEVVGTAFFRQSALLVSKMAGILGRTEDAARYGKLAADIKSAFNRAYVKEDGTIENLDPPKDPNQKPVLHGNTQSDYALALDLDLLPPEKRPLAANLMVKAIENYKWHISTGFHTTVRLMKELTKAGRNDVAYRLINNRTIPSWGYEIDHGATTIWERWDGWVEGRGFQDPGMNSFNHYAIGAVAEWMLRVIIGINPDEDSPAYKRFTLRPMPGGGLTWARGHYDSIRGRIACDWRMEGDTLHVVVTIPPNTSATVCIPARDRTAVQEIPQAGTQSMQGVTFKGMQDGAAAFEVGSGTYHFTSAGYKIPG